MKSIVILISGRGSNMEAILNAGVPLQIRAVISNRPHAAGLATAAAAGIPIRSLDHKLYASREEFDQALMHCIDEFAPDYVVLAGFMRILSEAFILRYPRRIINIHPSLLPSFPGLHTHQRALEAGVRIHGATVHFVTPRLDHGPIIIQAAVPVHQEDDESTLAQRVLEQEHRIYPQALCWLAEDRLEFSAGDVVQLRGSSVSLTDKTQHLVSPGTL